MIGRAQTPSPSLVAAAGDLLAAAEDALCQFRQMEKMFRDDIEFMAALEALVAAITKARGE